jgi:hypothetical protein
VIEQYLSEHGSLVVCVRETQRTLATSTLVSHKPEGLFDTVTIPRMIKILSEGFDPAGRLLLFCDSAIYAYGPVTGWAQIVESGKKFIGVAKTQLS